MINYCKILLLFVIIFFYFSEQGKANSFQEAFEEYRKYPIYKAFASSEDFTTNNAVWACSYGHSNQSEANKIALRDCEKIRHTYNVHTPCVLYAIGEKILLSTNILNTDKKGTDSIKEEELPSADKKDSNVIKQKPLSSANISNTDKQDSNNTKQKSSSSVTISKTNKQDSNIIQKPLPSSNVLNTRQESISLTDNMRLLYLTIFIL